MILQIEIEAIAAIIGTIGFPAVAFLLLYKMIDNQLARLTDAIRDLQREIASMRTIAEIEMWNSSAGKHGIDPEQIRDYLEKEQTK